MASQARRAARSGLGIGAGSGPPSDDDVDPDELFILESCHSTWVFDTPRQRFRRVLKGLELDPTRASTGWRDYYSLDLDEDSGRFVVVLNESGNRLIRSRRHLEHCVDCGADVTGELSLDELHLLIGA
jgi:hypothetical protein